MERKKIKSECDFIEFRNNRLNCKCKECGEECTKSKMNAIKNFPIMHQFFNGDLNKLFFAAKKRCLSL